MEAKSATIVTSRYSSPLPDLEVPIINTMVTCLESEHRRLNRLGVQMAFAATRLASDPDSIAANQQTLVLKAKVNPCGLLN
jgi:hypothetical protein